MSGSWPRCGMGGSLRGATIEFIRPRSDTAANFAPIMRGNITRYNVAPSRDLNHRARHIARLQTGCWVADGLVTTAILRLVDLYHSVILPSIGIHHGCSVSPSREHHHVFSVRGGRQKCSVPADENRPVTCDRGPMRNGSKCNPRLIWRKALLIELAACHYCTLATPLPKASVSRCKIHQSEGLASGLGRHARSCTHSCLGVRGLDKATMLSKSRCISSL